MAVHHVTLVCTIILLWHILVRAHPTEREYVSPGKSRPFFLHQPLRSPRKVSQRAFKDMDLFTARGYGKRSLAYKDEKRMPEFSGARLYGKRNIALGQLKSFFMDCCSLRNNIRKMDFPNQKFKRESETVLSGQFL